MNISIESLIKQEKKVNVTKNRRSFVWDVEIFELLLKDLYYKNNNDIHLGTFSLVSVNNVEYNKDGEIEKILNNFILNDGLQRMMGIQIILIALKKYISNTQNREKILIYKKMDIFSSQIENDNKTLSEISKLDAIGKIDLRNPKFYNFSVIDCFLFVNNFLVSLSDDKKVFSFFNKLIKIKFHFVNELNKSSLLTVHKLNNVLFAETDFIALYVGWLIQCYSIVDKDDIEQRREFEQFISNLNIPHNMWEKNGWSFTRSYFLEFVGSDSQISDLSLFNNTKSKIEKLINNKPQNIKNELLFGISVDLKMSFSFYAHYLIESDQWYRDDIKSFEVNRDEPLTFNEGLKDHLDIGKSLFLVRHIINDSMSNEDETITLLLIVYKLWKRRYIHSKQFIVSLEIIGNAILTRRIFKEHQSDIKTLRELIRNIENEIPFEKTINFELSIDFKYKYYDILFEYLHNKYLYSNVVNFVELTGFINKLESTPLVKLDLSLVKYLHLLEEFEKFEIRTSIYEMNKLIKGNNYVFKRIVENNDKNQFSLNMFSVYITEETKNRKLYEILKNKNDIDYESLFENSKFNEIVYKSIESNFNFNHKKIEEKLNNNGKEWKLEL